MSGVSVLFFSFFIVFALSFESSNWGIELNNHNNHNNYVDNLWGIYGSNNQLKLYKRNNLQNDNYFDFTFSLPNNYGVYIISAQCNTCDFPKEYFNLGNLKNNNKELNNIETNDKEVLVFTFPLINDNYIDNINHFVNELCINNIIKGPCGKSTIEIMNNYIFHIAKEFKRSHSFKISNNQKNILANANKEDDPINELINQVSEEKQREFLYGLTSVHTRLTTAETTTLQASYYIFGVLQGFGLEPFMYYYDTDLPPNVCADITGSLEPENIVVVGAHYDDRSSDITNESIRAPGANDDGSGCSLLQESARILSSSGFSFRYTTRFCFWSGEEQGLLGSSAYASALKSNNTNVIGMLQADMVGYLTPGDNYQVDMATRETSSTLTEFVNQITSIYVPDLKIGNTTSCCTDSASFNEEGYSAVAYNEPGGYTIDPRYHSTLDIVDRPGYSLELIGYITQAVIAATAVLAEII